MMKRKMILVLMSATMCMQHMYAQHDKDNYNQWASMEYKQWSFTPKSYYYNKYWGTVVNMPWPIPDIKGWIPGIGVHDKQGWVVPTLPYVPYYNFIGDNYVNESWRQMTKLRSGATVTHIIESSYTKKEDEHWNTVYKEDLATIADRNLEVSYSMTSDTRNRLKEQITDNLSAMNDDTADNFRLEYDRILANISNIRNAHMDNAKKIVAYENENRALEKLAVLTGKVAKIQLMDKFIKGGKEE